MYSKVISVAVVARKWRREGVCWSRWLDSERYGSFICESGSESEREKGVAFSSWLDCMMMRMKRRWEGEGR